MASQGLARTRTRLAAVSAALVLLATSLAIPASAAKPPPTGPLATRALFFAADGMRPDKVDAFAAEGVMPEMQHLMNTGVKGLNGMQPGFPPNTGVGWYTMMTGTWPSEHGSTNNTYHRIGEPAFNNRTSFSMLQGGAPTMQADTLAAAAERAGKKVAQIDWVGGVQSAIAGPTVDFTNFFSTRGVLTAPLNTTEQAGAAAFAISYQVAAFAPAAGWTNTPVGDDGVAVPQQTTLLVATTFAAQNPDRTYDVYIYDSVVDGSAAYDTVILVPASAAKNASLASADLEVGDFEEIKLTGANGLIGARAGQTAGFYTKLISLAPDLSSFKIYFTSVQRVIATCSTAACTALSSAGGTGLENYLADNFPTYIAGDFAPLEARVIDEDTYVEQGNDLHDAYADGVTNYILGTLQPNTDLAFVGFPTTDEIQHQFLALTVPTDIDGNPNPYYDDLEGNGTPDGLLAARQEYIRGAYEDADRALGQARDLMGGNPTTFVGADHGFAPQWYAVNAGKIMADAGITGTENFSNCRAPSAPVRAKVCWAGGTAQVYINVVGRDVGGVVAAADYNTVRNQIVAAYEGLTDPANPGATVVQDVFLKEELRNIQGVDALHPSRSGDVVVTLRPPYQFDAATPNVRIAFSQFFGQHGYLPDLVDLANDVNMHATFIAGGPGIRKQAPVAGVRQIDLAPTLAFMLNVPGPMNARGKILYGITAGTYKEITVLDISDYHGQLIPLAETADTVTGTGAANPTFPIGGAAFLKTWFDWYRAEAPNGSLTIAAGDSVGATPPISAFFGDTPTIELMNLMGFGLDGLGNHNFDEGSAYLRNTLIPLADFPYVSANVVDENGNTPAEWSKSITLPITFGGVKVGFVGYTNDDAPDLAVPGAFDPFEVTNSTTAVQAEVDALRSKKVNVILAIGHLGATGGTLTDPSGPLTAFADSVTNVDVVVGDHTNQQVIDTRPNGTLVTENLSKGARFTRIRIAWDSVNKRVAYKTADFHKPWTIGMAADPAIQSELDDLNAELTPLLGFVIGSSTVDITRADACGRSDGRLCESLIGDVVTDAMREAYAPIGVEFAITNSGGLRDRLTCDGVTVPGTGFCSAFTPPPYEITRGSVIAVLPFGNLVVTLQVNGAELKTILEAGVSSAINASSPFGLAANGRFPQVSGLCFTYDIEAAVGARVTGAVRQAADGSCTGAPVDLTGGSTYTIAWNDFNVTGQEGYPNFLSRASSQGLMAQVLEDYVVAHGTISPTIQGRIHCVDPNPGIGAACTIGSP